MFLLFLKYPLTHEQNTSTSNGLAEEVIYLSFLLAHKATRRCLGGRLPRVKIWWRFRLEAETHWHSHNTSNPAFEPRGSSERQARKLSTELRTTDSGSKLDGTSSHRRVWRIPSFMLFFLESRKWRQRQLSPSSLGALYVTSKAPFPLRQTEARLLKCSCYFLCAKHGFCETLVMCAIGPPRSPVVRSSDPSSTWSWPLPAVTATHLEVSNSNAKPGTAR